MKISIVNPAMAFDLVRPLVALNWAETGFDFDLAPDLSVYQRLFEAGVGYGVLAQDDGGAAVGYCSVAVMAHAFNPAVRVAANDTLFVAPEFRRGVTTGWLMAAAEREARTRGATLFAWHCRAGTGLAETLANHGCAPGDTVMIKDLRDGN